MLKTYYKIIVAFILACVLSFGAGWFSKKTESIPQVVTKTSEVSIDKTAETKKEIKQNVKTTRTEKKPDGTVTTEVTESQTQTAESIKEKIKEVTKEKVVVQTKRGEYSLGVGASLDLTDGFKALQPTYHLSVGKRVVGDLWVEVGYGTKLDFSRHEVLIMTRMEF